MFPSLRRASVFVIALNKGWLAAPFDAGGWSVIITPHAGSADGGGSSSTLPSKPPSPCSASAPRLGANCPRLQSHPPLRTDYPIRSQQMRVPPSRLPRTARGIALPGYVAHAECFETGMCFGGCVPDYAPSGLPSRGKSCFVWLADTDGKEARRSAAAPVAGEGERTA